MPTVTRCDCCDLPVEMCGKAAQQRLEREERDRLAQMLRSAPWFAASFPGRCGQCGEPFSAGYPIRASSKHGAYGRQLYVAACCEGKV